MRTFIILVLPFLVISCAEDKVSEPTLPSGCGFSSTFATVVLNSNLGCKPTNAFTDVSRALGAPDAVSTGSGKTEFRGFVSLGHNGSITVAMGACIEDLPGADLRVFQSVSREAVEVQVSQNREGPFISLGAKDCPDPSCDFDLAGSGLTSIRVVKILDREALTFPGSACDNTGLSPGADIDAVQVLHPAR